MLSPLAFLREPSLWMSTCAAVGATHTAAPNFGYDLLVRKTTPEQRRAWDLSRLRCVSLGGEPVHYATVRAFLDSFAPSGLARTAICPSFGLAEHTVGVTVFGSSLIC